MKKLSPKSSLNNADLDNNGIITDEEISKHERMIKIENDDKREDQIRLMAWFSLWGMLLYPSGIFFAICLALILPLTFSVILLLLISWLLRDW